jgi:hypothetical protein
MRAGRSRARVRASDRPARSPGPANCGLMSATDARFQRRATRLCELALARLMPLPRVGVLPSAVRVSGPALALRVGGRPRRSEKRGSQVRALLVKLAFTGLCPVSPVDVARPALRVLVEAKRSTTLRLRRDTDSCVSDAGCPHGWGSGRPVLEVPWRFRSHVGRIRLRTREQRV